MSKKTLFAAIAVVLVAALCTSYIPNLAIAATTKGECGDNLTWTYEPDTYTLTISGTGMMYDYEYKGGSKPTAPWYSFTIKNLVIDSGVTSIGDYAFYIHSFTSVTLPEKLASIGQYAFYDCSKMTEIVLPNSLVTIGIGAFQNCDSLTDVTIPSRVSTINSNTFYNCYSLASVSLPARLTQIGSNAFNDCTSLSQITIPDQVTSIGTRAFYNCDALSQIVIPDAVTTIRGETFYSCASLTDVQLPSALTDIGTAAFQDCSLLETITFPETLTTIGDSAFTDCSNLLELTIPASVTTIGTGAFTNGINILDITYGGAAPTIAEDAFTRVYADVHYPASATSWNADTMLNYGGDLYYEPYMDPASLIPELKLACPTLAFEGAVNYNVYFTATNASNFPLEDMGLILFDSMLADGTMDDAIEVIPGAQFNETSGIYMVHTNGIPAKNLGDTVYFKVYAKLADGSYVYSSAGSYNAVAYAKTILNGDYDQDLKDLATELMNYGAAAQQYFDYKLDAPMNDFITE